MTVVIQIIDVDVHALDVPGPVVIANIGHLRTIPDPSVHVEGHPAADLGQARSPLDPVITLLQFLEIYQLQTKMGSRRTIC